MTDTRLPIGEVADRTGVATSALRFYESEGLIAADRTDGGQRRFARDVIRRVAFIRVAQRVGLTLDDIREALDTLPGSRTPTADDWARLSSTWHGRIDERIALLEGLRDQLSSCIGCGCLSLASCGLANPGDRAASFGTGPRYLLGDRPSDAADAETP